MKTAESVEAAFLRLTAAKLLHQLSRVFASQSYFYNGLLYLVIMPFSAKSDHPQVSVREIVFQYLEASLRILRASLTHLVQYLRCYERQEPVEKAKVPANFGVPGRFYRTVPSSR